MGLEKHIGGFSIKIKKNEDLLIGNRTIKSKSKFKNMNWFLKVLLTAVAVLILAYVLPGVEVASYFSAIIVAIVLAILRLLVKPILVVLTFPITLITLGLFLLIINAIIGCLTYWRLGYNSKKLGLL